MALNINMSCKFHLQPKPTQILLGTIQNITNFQQIQGHNGTKPSKYKHALP
jgi:hypothetical protein